MTGLDSSSIPSRFQYTLFIVVEKLAASGYGGFVPRTSGHIVLSFVLILIGRVLECYIAGKIFSKESRRRIYFQSLIVYESHFSDADSNKSRKTSIGIEISRNNKSVMRLHESKAITKAYEDSSSGLLLLSF